MKLRPRRQWAWLLLLFGLACSDVHTNLVSDPEAGTAPERDATSTSDVRPLDAAGQSSCGNKPCVCDDGIDNDGDSLIDGLDPECTGSFDNDETLFAIGKPNKQNQCRDCYWDDNAGSGDDDCRYPAECLTGAIMSGAGNCASCEVSLECQGKCAARTPNGCDCFGCCQVERGAGEMLFIELTDDCSLAQIDDEKACPRCVPDTLCANPCGRCELCLGREPNDLPADCPGASTPDGPTYACDDASQQVCSTSRDCMINSYCQLGCCLPELL